MNVPSAKSTAYASSAAQHVQQAAMTSVYKKTLNTQAQAVNSLVASATSKPTPGTGAASPQANLGQNLYEVA